MTDKATDFSFPIPPESHACIYFEGAEQSTFCTLPSLVLPGIVSITDEAGQLRTPTDLYLHGGFALGFNAEVQNMYSPITLGQRNSYIVNHERAKRCTPHQAIEKILRRQSVVFNLRNTPQRTTQIPTIVVCAIYSTRNVLPTRKTNTTHPKIFFGIYAKERDDCDEGQWSASMITPSWPIKYIYDKEGEVIDAEFCPASNYQLPYYNGSQAGDFNYRSRSLLMPFNTSAPSILSMTIHNQDIKVRLLEV